MINVSNRKMTLSRDQIQVEGYINYYFFGQVILEIKTACVIVLMRSFGPQKSLNLRSTQSWVCAGGDVQETVQPL